MYNGVKHAQHKFYFVLALRITNLYFNPCLRIVPPVKKVGGKTKNKRKPKKKGDKGLIAFRADEALRALIEDAAKAAGTSKTKVIVECIRRNITAAAAEFTRERANAAERLEENKKTPREREVKPLSDNLRS